MGTTPDLKTVAQKHALSPALALGLGAGIYFEYFCRSQPSPTRFIAGTYREMEPTLVMRLNAYQADPRKSVREALRENALRFNLDGAPTTALLGMEMLAEELPHFDEIVDGRACLGSMAETIVMNRALYRRTYAEFLNEIAPEIFHAGTLASELVGIATEWETLAGLLLKAAGGSELERASSLVRRLAFREEHFWGTMLDTVV